MEEKKPIRVMIVDDHPLVRVGLTRTIENEPDMCVCGEAESVSQALKEIESTQPNFVVVDLSLDESDGVDLIRILNEGKVITPVLVVSMHEEPYYIEKAFKAGARGYLLKRESIKNITNAIRTILSGGIYASETVSSKFLQTFSFDYQANKWSPQDLLGRRELEVFEMLGAGLQKKDIAVKLNISTKTVETHIERIKKKLKLDSGLKLIHYAIRYNIKSK